MKAFLPLTLLAGLLAAGCSSGNSHFSAVPGPSGGATVAVSNKMQTPPAQPMQTPQPKASEQPQPPQAVVTPDNSLAGKVVTYNSVGRFVVLRFPEGQMPKDGQTLFVYRSGLKVGELKVSGEQRDSFIVADVVNGDAQPDDEARDQ